MSSEIRAQIEELDQIVKGFSTKLGNYVRDMGDKTNGINEIVAALGSSWSGAAYDSFKKKMIIETEKMGEALKRGDNLKRELDEISAQFTDALATLRESGE